LSEYHFCGKSSKNRFCNYLTKFPDGAIEYKPGPFSAGSTHSAIQKSELKIIKNKITRSLWLTGQYSSIQGRTAGIISVIFGLKKEGMGITSD